MLTLYRPAQPAGSLNMENANKGLTDLASHFAFGENWIDYAKSVSEGEIAEASRGLSRLVGTGDLSGLRFLDIGCGSGIHSLAAQRMGASVTSIDLDPASVTATESLLSRFSKGNDHSVSVLSVFDLRPEKLGTFDMVYSWGVLHHTGDMRTAIQRAAEMVKPNGKLVLALYRRTWLCWFWKIEKRWYARASLDSQNAAQRTYLAWFKLISSTIGVVRGTKFRFEDFARNYRMTRGMDVQHDVHDWLGGYPYESALPKQIAEMMKFYGFSLERLLPIKKSLGKIIGIFGSGCDEYVFVRNSDEHGQ